MGAELEQQLPNGSERLVPVIVPPLIVLLQPAESKKDGPLTEAEVLEIRDGAPAIMLPYADALMMAERRGYVDIDPRPCWEQWQIIRSQLSP
jgi:hypothetical protein